MPLPGPRGGSAACGHTLRPVRARPRPFARFVMMAPNPTIMKIVMNDVQSGGSSEIDVSSVKYDKQAPAGLFDPKNLPQAASDAFWKSAAH
jgi:hypothetical protein